MAARRPRGRNLLGWAAVLITLVALYGPTFLRHVRASMDPLRFHDDVRIHIFPYFRYEHPEAFAQDYLGTYSIEAFQSIGFHLFYRITAFLWDPEPMSKTLPYVLLVLLVLAVGRAVYPFGGKIAVLTSAVVCLGSSLFIERMGGGLSRAFAFPAIAGCVAALVAGRPWVAAAMVWVGAAFYPMAGVAMGAGLTASVLAAPADGLSGLEKRPYLHRLIYLGGVALVSGLILMPLVLSQREYAPMVTYLDIPEYPEAGPGGVMSRHDIPPYETFFEETLLVAPRVVFGDGQPIWKAGHDLVRDERGRRNILELVFFALLIGLWPLVRSDLRARRVVLFVAGIAVAHGLSRVLAPYAYTPSRYVHYGLPPLIAVMLPLAAWGFGAWLRSAGAPRWSQPVSAGALCLLAIGVLGGRGSDSAGLTVHVRGDLASIYEDVSALPEGVVIAGWPDDEMSNVPYVARRQAYLTGEMFMPHHAAHLDELRRRMRPFIEAYLAREVAPIRRLRDDEGVTHMLVSLDRLRGQPPGYMPPMGAWISDLNARADRTKPYVFVDRLGTDAVVGREGKWVLYDLSRI